jgi:Platelet-activating factor acetylhydrolase, isoform II
MKFFKGLFKFFKWSVAIGIASILLIFGFFWIEHELNITLPKPTGSYDVGRIEYNWTDSTRNDILASTPGIKRELTVWIWYPADSADKYHSVVKYRPDSWVAAEDSAVGFVMRNFLTQDLSKVHPHAVHSAAVSQKQARYPVVFFKPGIGALATDYTTLCEDLASHGYIVVASESPFSSFIVVYNDGHVVTRAPSGNPGEMIDQVKAKQLAENLIPIWSADLHFELNKLKQLNKSDPSKLFTGRLNFREIGVFGHSFGGATAAQFCYDEPECKAGIDIDGQPFGKVAQVGLQKPFLFILSDHKAANEPGVDEIMKRIHLVTGNLPNRLNQITIKGTRHFNFSDMALLKEHFISKFFLGPIDKRRALFITSRYILAFFDTYLKNAPDQLMKSPSIYYPEVKIQLK